MITRQARVRELTRRVHEDGSIALSAQLSMDEGCAFTIRLSAEEHAAMETAMIARTPLEVEFQVGSALRSRSATESRVASE